MRYTCKHLLIPGADSDGGASPREIVRSSKGNGWRSGGNSSNVFLFIFYKISQSNNLY